MAPQEHYHVFSLPSPLLESLIPRNIVNQSASDHHSRPISPAPAPSSTLAAASRACNICLGAEFADVDEQRAHFRSDWHRYNVKMRVGGSNAVTEAQFSQLVDGEYFSYIPSFLRAPNALVHGPCLVLRCLGASHISSACAVGEYMMTLPIQ